MKYYKFYWNESPGGEQEHWGKSQWYIQLDDEMWPIRQIQMFENGPTLKYDSNKKEDEFGILGDQQFNQDQIKEIGAELISSQEFELKWEEF